MIALETEGIQLSKFLAVQQRGIKRRISWNNNVANEETVNRVFPYS